MAVSDYEPRRYRRRPGDMVVRVRRIRPWRVAIARVPRARPAGWSPLWLIYGFLIVIAAGTILLVLPISSKSGGFTSFVNALFTATSGVCVTGLVVADTFDYWSLFGQIVIFLLIQIGGFGFMTSATIFLIVIGRRIGLRERLLIRESLGVPQLGGLLRIARNMALFTLLSEAVGAGILAIRFSRDFSGGNAAWKSIFTSVSAFNNAGFDVFGGFQSITAYRTDPLVVLAAAALIILGGISFFLLRDVFTARGLRQLSLDTRLILIVTASLLVLGTLAVFVAEYSDPATLGTMSIPGKLLNSFFISATARTAGFTTLNVAVFLDYVLFTIMFLMFVGGASGSTAGGIKVNTFGLLLATVWSSIRGSEHPGAFGREFLSAQIFRALAVIMLALAVVVIMTLVLTVTEEASFLSILFETVSAFGTVGLSTGITPELSTAGRFIITATMFIGRLGPLALTVTLIARQRPAIYRFPTEGVRIG